MITQVIRCVWCGDVNTSQFVMCPSCDELAKAMKARWT